MFRKICLAFLLLTSLSFLSYADELKTYKPNEDIIITNKNGQYRIKFFGIRETQDRNHYSDVKADRVIFIDYEYENLSINEQFAIQESISFKLYDKDGYRLERYPAVGTKSGNYISKGRKTNCSIAYALNNANSYVELEYSDDYLGRFIDFKIIFEW